MNKIASYLQEHLEGEVSSHPATLDAMSRDASIIEIKPELVIYPRITNDIRKIARFSWQLAEKGHALPITPRGSGSDKTGAAIGPGSVVSTLAHMNELLEYDAKQKLVRVQPGIVLGTLNRILAVHGTVIPSVSTTEQYSTLGGAVANGARGPRAGKYGGIEKWVYQLEVVLANGEVLQTGRISKKELARKKGLQTLEGEIYRNLDNLIDDSGQVIGELASTYLGNVGYGSIVKVKQKDGSVDLTPLFIGSQGTLGVISELILRTHPVGVSKTAIVLVAKNRATAHDIALKIKAFEPSILNYYDSSVFRVAAESHRSYPLVESALSSDGAVLIVELDDAVDRVRHRKVKKIKKLVASLGDVEITVADNDEADALLNMCRVTSYTCNTSESGESAPPLFDAAFIPPEHFASYCGEVELLAKKYDLGVLPIYGRIDDNLYFVRARLQLRNVSERQKALKLLDEYSSIVHNYGGQLIAESGEGRILPFFTYRYLSEQAAELFVATKSIFDPYGILNPGVKQLADVKSITSKLRTSYDSSSRADYIVYN